MAASGSLWTEFKRKFIHLLNIWIPALYLYLSYHQMLAVIAIGVVICLSVDLLRNEASALGRFVSKVLSVTGLLELFRPQEKDGRLTGATHIFLSALICVILFDREIFIIAFTILIISDTLAAMFGTAFGVKNKDTGKSVAGTEAFSMSALCISLAGGWFFHLSIFSVTCAALVTSVAEHKASRLKLDDNFVVPLVYCGSYLLFGMIGI